jgi:hypothetical protein
MVPRTSLNVIRKGRKEGLNMIVYQVFVRREHDRGEFLGVLPERRTNKQRVNSESIINWAKSIFGGTIDTCRVFFLQENI